MIVISLPLPTLRIELHSVKRTTLLAVAESVIKFVVFKVRLAFTPLRSNPE